MKRAAAIVTNRGGRTCHAAIIARELGIPAVVGTGSATKELSRRPRGHRLVRRGRHRASSTRASSTSRVERTELDEMPDIPVKIMMNVGTPDQAFAFAQLPHRGVGLARLEFIINRQIGIHPKALLELERDPDSSLDDGLRARDRGDRSRPTRARGSSSCSASPRASRCWRPRSRRTRSSCGCRTSSPTSTPTCVAGPAYEPDEENPMIGYRGASRYLSEEFADCFAMECEALRHVRDDMGLTNVWVMIPFVRTARGGAAASSTCSAEHGLERGKNDLKVVMMCEIPSNAVIADQFLEHFDGFSIGSNDMTQLTLGLDRDSALVAERLRRARPGGAAHARAGHQGLQEGRASTSASAARAPPTTPTWPSGCSSRASSRCPSTPTPSSTPGCGWPASRSTDLRPLLFPSTIRRNHAGLGVFHA